MIFACILLFLLLCLGLHLCNLALLMLVVKL